MSDSPNRNDDLESTDPPALKVRRRRRRLLSVSAGALIAVSGMSLGLTQWMPVPEPLEIELDELTTESRYVGYFAAADAKEESYDEAGGTGQRHKGEEGKMGKPTTKNKSGLYAIKGPKDAIPQMARSFDPADRGVLGVMEQNPGHFLASPNGAAFAVENADRDVWGGLTGNQVGAAYGVGGLGLVGGRGAGAEISGREAYDRIYENDFIRVADDPRSTFSIDVDTASYSNMRRYINGGSLPPPDAVRIEELVNYFDYDYEQPQADEPFSVTSEAGPCPWNDDHRLVHVGLQGKLMHADELPPRNLVFLIDVSGSMGDENKLPLVKRSLAYLADTLTSEDRVAIVVYAGAAGLVLPPTSGNDKRAIMGALGRLQSGGSTNGGEGIELAYRAAREHFVDGGINRVVLATDGDFNVGTTGRGDLMRLIEKQRKTGVFLSVLGYGMGNLQDSQMEQLADKGNGNYAYIDGLAEARKVLVDEAGSTLVTIAKDVKLQVEFNPARVASYRLVGYENRVLAHKDFNDDTKDAGEIGAGHTVTALYEVVPANGDSSPTIDPLEYQSASVPLAAAESDEVMTVKIRYKDPDASKSKPLSFAIEDRGGDDSSDDFRFSAAVAELGMLLRDSKHKGDADYAEVLELATGSLGEDAHCYRSEFVGLAAKAAELSDEEVPAVEIQCEPGEPVRAKVESRPPTERPTENDVSESNDHDDTLSWTARILGPAGWIVALADFLRGIPLLLHLLPMFLALPMLWIAARLRPRG